MKAKIIIVVLAIACVGLVIGLLAVKKQGEAQRAADLSTIVDFSNQVVNATLKINDLNQVNLALTNDLALSQQQGAQLSNQLAATAATLAESRTALASTQTRDQDTITNLTARINDLEAENHALDQRASDLTNTIAKLDAMIQDTQAKLNTTEKNNQYLQQELQKQLAQKAEIEHKFNDLDELRQQVKKIKTELFVARRLQFMKNDNSQKKGAQLLMDRSVTVTNEPPPPAAPNYGLNVEVGSDGSVRMISPLVAPTNAPAAH